MSDTNLAVSKPSFFDPIYKTEIKMTPLEKELVATQVFERLKGIKQLGLADLIYPNAKHSRFEHCLGTMHLAGKVADSLGLSQEDTESFRTAALLHDVGHGPFSHAFEDYMRERKKIRGHEDLTKWVILNSEIKDIINSSPFDLERIANLSTGKVKDEKIDFLNSLILGAIDVDQMDFLVRDAYLTGKRRVEIDTEKLTSSVRKLNKGRIAWDYQCLASLEKFFRSKNYMYMSVYYSEKVRAIDIMIKAMLKYSEEQFDWCDFKEFEDFKLLTDSLVLGRMQEVSQKTSLGDEISIAVGLYKDLIGKNLLKNVFEKIYFSQYRPRKDFILNEEEILNRLIDYLNVDRRLVFVDSLNFSPRFVMSFTQTDEDNVYLLGTRGFGNVTNIQDTLKQLLDLSCQIVRVYVTSKYAKKLSQIGNKIHMIVQNLLAGT